MGDAGNGRFPQMLHINFDMAKEIQMSSKEMEISISVPVTDKSDQYYLHQEYATLKTPDGKECTVVMAVSTFCPVIEFADGRRYMIDMPAVISRIAEKLY